jgi:hypothetical protein
MRSLCALTVCEKLEACFADFTINVEVAFLFANSLFVNLCAKRHVQRRIAFAIFALHVVVVPAVCDDDIFTVTVFAGNGDFRDAYSHESISEFEC